MSDHDDQQPDTPLDPTAEATEAALAELDRRGRHAALALRSAVATILPPPLTAPGSNGSGHVDAGVPAPPTAPPDDDELVVIDLQEERTRTPAGRAGRGRRLALVAAGVALVGGLVAVRLADSSTPTVQVAGVGAPTAAIGDDGGGIYPPDAPGRGYVVASPEHTEVWDQWTLDVPPAGRHLILELSVEGVVFRAVLDDIGSTPLQATAFDGGSQLPTVGEAAVYGVVDAAVDGRGLSRVTVERPGTAAVEMYVEPLEGATHNAFVGFLPGDLGPDAEIVAVAPDGRELYREPLTLPTGDDPVDGGLYPDSDAVHIAMTVTGESDRTGWAARTDTGGHHVVLDVYGREDSVSTVIERPGSLPLQVLATRLDGVSDEPATTRVYGLVDATAVDVELLAPGADPVPADLTSFDTEASHQVFVIPTDADRAALDGAVVVARDAAGNEVERRPLTWTTLDVAYPD